MFGLLCLPNFTKPFIAGFAFADLANLRVKIFEILNTTDQQPELKARIEKFLNNKKTSTKDLSTLISWGFRLVEYHKKPEYQATLHASPR